MNDIDSTKKKELAWNYALGIIKVDNLSPSAEFLQLVEQEKKGEITDEDILGSLTSKYFLQQE